MQFLKKIIIVSAATASQLLTNMVNLSENLEILVVSGDIKSAALLSDVKEWLQTAQTAKETPRGLSNVQIKAIIALGKSLALQTFIETDESDGLGFELLRGGVSNKDKFLGYGCYCSPTEMHMSDGNWVGTGTPVDAIDEMCQKLFYGYQCLKQDYQACDATNSYNWKVAKNGSVTCLDKAGSCEGDLCRIDIEFSTNLFKLKKQWQPMFHSKNGFDRVETCQGSGAPSSGATDSSKTDRSLQDIELRTSCCGVGLGRHIFNKDRMECCEDGQSRPRGTC